jgi:hypothetical protein
MSFLIYYRPKVAATDFGYYLVSDFACTLIDANALSELSAVFPKYITVSEAGFTALQQHIAENARNLRSSVAGSPPN